MVTASVAPMRAPESPGSATCVTSCDCGTGFAFDATGAVDAVVETTAFLHGDLVVLVRLGCALLPHVGVVAVVAAFAATLPQAAVISASAHACRNDILLDASGNLFTCQDDLS